MKKKRLYTDILLFVITVLIQCCLFEYAAMELEEWVFIKSEVLTCINIALVVFPILVLMAVLGDYRIALQISNIICLLWSIINFYVIKLHGYPLSFSTMMNARTAFAVLNGYKFSVDKRVLIIFLLGLFTLIINRFIMRTDKNRNFVRIVSAVLLLLNSLFIYTFLFSSFAVKSRRTIGWSWTDSLRQYGYLPFLVEDTQNTLNPITIPENYNVGKIQYPEVIEIENSNQYPDIIFILNESFFDLNVYSTININEDFMKDFYHTPNAVFGKSVSPMIGGGTNNSEYELLTANSMYLLNADAPFNYINLSKGSNLVRHLRNLGYETAAMHCAAPTNYCRNIGYPSMGFDHVILGKESFKYLNYNGNRPWLDTDNYQDMIEVYEKMEDGPRFIYLLTYQNHGGYDQNNEELDTIHVVDDYGNLTDDINEYLSSLHLSVESFKNLTEYFSLSERPIVICMLGDHAPSFINDMEYEENIGTFNREIDARSVPYVIWSNTDMMTDHVNEYIPIFGLGPMVFQMSKLPLSGYYKNILQLTETVPVLTSYGEYVTNERSICQVSQKKENYELIQNYYYMEYNLISCANDYLKDAFEKPGY